jgi:hypothetical protein
MKMVITGLVRKVASLLHRLRKLWKGPSKSAITFFPSPGQVKGLETLSGEARQKILTQIARDEMEVFYRCGGKLSPSEWFSLSQIESLLYADVVIKVERENRKQLALVFGNSEYVELAEEIYEGSYNLRWKKLVDREMKILKG